MTTNRTLFPASRPSALAHWEHFLPRLAEYASQRNYIEEGHPNVSRLSPAIRCRSITEEEMVRNLRERFPFSTVEKFVQELLWRSYWKAWLETHPEVWTDYKRQFASASHTLLPEQTRRIRAIQMADSGIAVIDRFTRELLETGYLHNHARMWWASYWIHVEKLPWPLGADFFYRHLLDGDAASNTLSWRWVAGLQTRGKPYLVRRSNIEKYLSPGLLDVRGLDQLADARVEAVKLDDHREFPFSLVPHPDLARTLDGKRWGLWLHEEDLSPEGWGLSGTAPVSICGFTAFGDDPMNKPELLRADYLRASLHDGTTRAATYWNLRADQVELIDNPSPAMSLAEWAERLNLEVIALSRPGVGFLRDQLPEVEAHLKEQGIGLVTIARRWDENLCSYARRGFFAFWNETKPRLIW